MVAGLLLFMAGAAEAQPAPRGGQFAPRSSGATIAAPAGRANGNPGAWGSRGGVVLAQPVAPPVPGVLSNEPPPRYDGLALGHAQYANQPPPLLGRSRVGDRSPYDGDLRAGSGYDGYDQGRTGGYGGTSAPAYGGGYPVPYPVEGGPARRERAASPDYGSSTRIDGE